MARGARRSFSRSPSRKTSWDLGPKTSTDGATQPVTTSSIVVASQGVQILVDGETHVRLRGALNLFLTLCDAAGNGFTGAFGVGIVNVKAFAAGTGSLLAPLSEEDWDGWIYHRYFGLFAGGPIAAATAMDQTSAVNPTSAALNVEVDSKAMRKLKLDDVIYAAIEVVEVGTAAMEFGFNSRTLSKLL